MRVMLAEVQPVNALSKPPSVSDILFGIVESPFRNHTIIQNQI